MNEVSGRTTAFALDVLRQRGFETSRLFKGTDLDEGRFADPRADVSWEDHLDFLDRVEAECGSDALDALGGWVLSTRPRGSLRTVARLAWTEKRLWKMVATRYAPVLYRVPSFSFESIEAGRFRLGIAIPPDRRGSENFMRVQCGYLRAIPRLLGEARDADIGSSISSHSAIFEIQSSVKPSLSRRLKNAVGGMRAAVDEINLRQLEAERATGQILAGRRSLAALTEVASTVTESTDLSWTAGRIVDAVIDHTDAEAATLYLLDEDKSVLSLAASRAPRPVSVPQQIPHSRAVSRHVLEAQTVLWARSADDLALLNPDLARAMKESELQGFAVIPLRLHHKLVGTLGLGFTAPHEGSAEEDTALLTLGATASAALAAAQQVTQLEREAARREEIERELRRSEERLRQIAENVDGVFYLLDIQTRELLYISPRFEAMSGYSIDSLREGGRPGYLEVIHPEDQPRVVEAMVGLEETGEYEVEYRMRTRAGQTLDVLERVRLLRGSGDEGSRAVGFAQDVSHVRAVESQLRHAQKMEAVGRLAGGIAHDFNNLLTVILGNGEILQSLFEPEHEGHGIAAEMLSAGERAGRLTRGLLSLARKQTAQADDLDLATVLAELLPMFHSLAGPNIEIDYSRPSEELIVHVDRSQIEQVLMNLVVNACDAMPDGGTVRLETLGAESEESLVIRVSDTGVGMTNEQQSLVFEPFYSTKDSGRNSGLGLSIVHGILEQAGGSIRIESAPGEGSCFEIRLPRGTKATSLTASVEQEPTRGHETILLVEDQDAVRATTATSLRTRGYRVIEASDGPDALEKLSLATETPDLMLTDVMMPGMNGVELSRQVSGRWPALPVMYMSGFPGDALPSTRDELAIVTKPFTPDDLAAAIRRRLDAPG